MNESVDGISEPQSARKTLTCPVVGLGASAGGLESLRDFFRSVPDRSGLIFVIIQHLSSEHPSHLAELLANYTSMPVRQVLGSTDMEVDHVYVIPPNALLTVKDCELQVSMPVDGATQRMPIDHFFRSLAEDQAENAVGVVLSGAGADGAVGLQAIKKHGGLTLVQTPESSRHDGMPKAAIATGMVDHALPVEDMPAKLIAFFEYRARILKIEGPESQGNDVLGHLGKFCSLLSERLGHDFSRYKQSTLVRRIQRRMQLQRVEQASEYLDLLAENPVELEYLFKDLLISVTQFFRDRDLWDVLARRVIPKIFHARAAADTDGAVRVWVPGCASGQEAYSIAILLKEYTERTGIAYPVQIFATDIDEEALEIARQGQYSDEIAEQISRERLSRFFIRHNGTFQIAKEIRDMCIFSVHNVITDPPFSRMDLVSCRNVLIYFEAALQQKIIPVFHYALKPGGFLVLGPAESLGPHQESFRPVDKRLRIFQGKENRTRVAVRLPRADGGRSNRIVMDSSFKIRTLRERDAREAHERVLVERFSHPSVLIDEAGEILNFVRNTERFLVPPTGAPSHNLFDMVRDDLRVPLRAALHQAKSTGQRAVRDGVEVEAGREIHCISLVIEPVHEVKEQNGAIERYVVLFEEKGAPRLKEDVMEAPSRESYRRADAEAIQQLERELRSTKECLQATIEELENSNEELKSSNEELISINEEYQSANESLQSSKEELQSLNEELETLNAELSKKVEELDRANADMRNFFESTRIATIFLNRELCIEKFTPAARELFNLIDSDIGRPLLDLNARFDLEPLLRDINQVNTGKACSEREVYVSNGNSCYAARVLPYRTSDQIRDGVVINFIDITTLKGTEEKLRQALYENEKLHAIGAAFTSEFDIQRLLQKITDAATDATKAQFGAFFYNTVNEQGEAYTLYTISGVPREAFSGFPMPRNTHVFAPTFNGEGPVRSDDITKDSRYGQNPPYHGMPKGHLPVVSYLAVPVVGRSGEVIGGLFFGHREPGVFDEHSEKLAVGIAAQAAIALDNARMIDALKKTARDLELSDQRFRQLADAMPQIVFMARPDGYADYFNQRWYEYAGLPAIGGDDGWLPILHPDDLGRCRDEWYRCVRSGKPYEIRYRFHDRRSGGYRWHLGRALPVRDSNGTIIRWFGTCTDIDDLVHAEEALREAAKRKDEFLAMLGHELRNPLAPLQNGLQILNLPDIESEVVDGVKEMLQRQIQHLSHIVDDLLDVSRISSGKIVLKTEVLDLTALVRTASEDQRASIQANRLTLQMTLPSAPVWIKGDRTRLSQVISNLLHNATKFTDPGGEIRVSLISAQNAATITIGDTGIGMSPELQKRVFEPFSQADTSLDRSRGGLGLGLAVVKGLVELHSGSVAVQSEGYGRGSTFTIELPLTDQKPVGEGQDAAPQLSRGQRIVLIEDNSDAARSLALLLRRRGHEVATAEDGENGIAEVLRLHAEIVICDIGLPGDLDGYAVARTLRARNLPYVKLMIALSGYGQEEDQRLAQQAGFNIHLTKPVDLSTLEMVMAEQLV